MPRHVAYSAKKRKVQLKEKRAIKRGDVEAPDPSTVSRWTKKKRNPHHGRPLNLAPGAVDPEERAQAARKLQSAFLKPSRSFLDLSQRLAAELPLPRPIPSDAMYPPLSLWDTPDDIGCPRRPEWRFDMSKSEIEDNEQRQYNAWLESAKEKFSMWRGSEARSSEELIEPEGVKSPSYFELNLEVWRQLWVACHVSKRLLTFDPSGGVSLNSPQSSSSFLTPAAHLFTFHHHCRVSSTTSRPNDNSYLSSLRPTSWAPNVQRAGSRGSRDSSRAHR